jgi:calcineurin-like phosphoesterase family protein
MTIWFTADHHFNHANIIKYCNRPFNSIEEMNEELIRRWNKKVGAMDKVFYLGDFGFGNMEEILLRLFGYKYIIPGSHDKITSNIRLIDGVEILPSLYELGKLYDFTSKMTIRLDRPITLCHYAMRTWKESHYNSWHLFAHSHGNLPSWGKSFDCGVDTHNFYPYSLDEVGEIMDKLPDNFNLIDNSSNYDARQMRD